MDPLLRKMFRQHEQLVFGPQEHTSPAPWNTMVWSHILLLVMRSAARSPATATAAVPGEHLKIDLRHFIYRIHMFIVHRQDVFSKAESGLREREHDRSSCMHSTYFVLLFLTFFLQERHQTIKLTAISKHLKKKS